MRVPGTSNVCHRDGIAGGQPVRRFGGIRIAAQVSLILFCPPHSLSQRVPSPEPLRGSKGASGSAAEQQIARRATQ